jgi:hypothetical protein
MFLVASWVAVFRRACSICVLFGDIFGAFLLPSCPAGFSITLFMYLDIKNRCFVDYYVSGSQPVI